MDYAQAEKLYQITQRMDANTGLRNAVLKFLAGAGVVVDEQRIDPDKALDAAIEAYRRQGKSEKWTKSASEQNTAHSLYCCFSSGYANQSVPISARRNHG
jgi:hypothetical protein